MNGDGPISKQNYGGEADLMTFLLGKSAIERKSRFLIGIGIGILVFSCLMFAIHEMDEMVLDQMRLNQPPIHQSDLSERTTTRKGELGLVASKELPQDQLRRAISYRRARMIMVGLVATLLAMLYSNAVLWYILNHRP
jgi:hypothetical protein